MKEEFRCLARIKVRGKWYQCTHPADHGGRHTYRGSKGYRFFTESQARYWSVKVKKRKPYDAHPTPIDAHLTIKLPHGYFVDPKDGDDDKGDGSPARPLKTNEAARSLYVKRGVRPEGPFELSAAAQPDPNKVIRVPVKYDYAAIHPEFLKMLAEIGSYADAKYGSWSQYLKARLGGNAAPVNHIYEHLRSYQMLERYDHFEGDVRRHLAAIAYNAMMEFAAHCKWGPAQSEYAKGIDLRPWPPPSPTEEAAAEEQHFKELTKPEPVKKRRR